MNLNKDTKELADEILLLARKLAGKTYEGSLEQDLPMELAAISGKVSALSILIETFYEGEEK